MSRRRRRPSPGPSLIGATLLELLLVVILFTIYQQGPVSEAPTQAAVDIVLNALRGMLRPYLTAFVIVFGIGVAVSWMVRLFSPPDRA